VDGGGHRRAGSGGVIGAEVKGTTGVSYLLGDGQGRLSDQRQVAQLAQEVLQQSKEGSDDILQQEASRWVVGRPVGAVQGKLAGRQSMAVQHDPDLNSFLGQLVTAQPPTCSSGMSSSTPRPVRPARAVRPRR